MATMGSNRLPYEPTTSKRDIHALDQIYTTPLSSGEYRYLKLEGYDSTGLLKCCLVPGRFAAAESLGYTAISYACDESEAIWYGTYDHQSPKPISINDITTLVPNKVANILCMMQQNQRMLLWLDAICINQNDNDEKSIQVARMGEIYSHAAEVISVLGQPTRETDLALQPKLWTNANLYATNYDDLFYGMDQVLTERIYWRRAWVLQEIALARKTLLCCGSYMIEYGQLKELLDMLRGQRFDLFDFKNASSTGRHLFSWTAQRIYQSGLTRSQVRPSRISDTRSMFRTFKSVFLESSHGRPFEIGTEKDIKRRPFLDVLRRSKQFNQCQNPRDLLYSRLALASDSEELVSSPDYNISVEEVFRRFATNCISTTRSLDVITYATRSNMTIPSWVPDWSTQFHDWEPGRDRAEDANAMAAITWEPGHRPQVSSRDENELLAPGRILATIIAENSSTKRGVDKAYQVMFDITTKGEYDESETPRPGDVVCILQGCSLLVFLRCVQDHYIVVGRNDRWQKKIFNDYVKDQLWVYKTKNHAGEDDWKWKFKDPERVSALQQKTFRIR